MIEERNLDFEPTDDEFDAAFAAQGKGEEVTPPEPSLDAPPDDTPPAEPPDDTVVDDPEPNDPAEKPPAEDPPSPAMKALDERAGDDDAAPPGDEPPTDQPPVQPPTVPAGAPPADHPGGVPPKPDAEAPSAPADVEKITTDSIKAVIASANLGDITIKAPGEDGGVLTDVNLNDFAEQYPETAAVAVAIAKHISKQAVGEAGKAQADAIKTAVEAAVAPLQEQIATTNFWMDVQNPSRDGSPGMPDALATARSDGFKEWKGKQRPAIQRLCTSNDPEDAIAVLAAYKEHKARENKAAGDKKRGASHKRETDIHRESSRGRAADGGGGKDGEEGSFDDSFEREAAAAEERKKKERAERL